MPSEDRFALAWPLLRRRSRATPQSVAAGRTGQPGWSARGRLLRTLLGGVAVAVMGEVFISPFGTAFRFTLGPLTFHLLTLVFTMMHPLPVAMIAGLVIVAYHSAAFVLGNPGPHWLPALTAALNHYGPEFIAYTTLGTLASLGQVQRRLDRPAAVVVILALADLGCNLVELLVRGFPLELRVVVILALTGVGRAAVATGLFEVARASERERRWDAERQAYASRLVFLSKLQTDIFFLRKSAAEVETIAERAHSLYRRLRGRQTQADALSIARDIHEVKKDYQRTLASLSRLLDVPGLAPTMRLSEVVQLVLDTNGAYAQTLGKQITFVTELKADFATERFGRWITILNNLVTNGIEACPEQGRITVQTSRVADRLCVEVADTGSGISPANQACLFAAGFSTKVNPETGCFSGGLGLTHVAELVRSVHGEVLLVESGTAGTTFRVTVPWAHLEAVAEGAAN